MALRRTAHWDETVEKMKFVFIEGIWVFSEARVLTRIDGDGNLTGEKFQLEKGMPAIATRVSLRRTKNQNKMEIYAHLMTPMGSICKISLFVLNPHFIADVRYNPCLQLGLRIL